MKRKTLLTLVLSLLLVGGIIGGSFAMAPKAVAEESNPEWLSSFTMVAGAEVRTADPNGIRFTTEISASEYNALMAKVEAGEYQSVEFGTLICPMEYAENGAIKSESNEHVTKIVRTSWDVEYNPALQTSVYQYNGDLLGLADADLAREYQALGYCTITPAQGEAVTYYAAVEKEGDNVRSPLYVAAYNVSVFGSDNEYLLAMIDSAMAGKTLTLSQTSASLTWKQVIDFPIVATVDGLEVSVVYYVEDESIASYENGKLTAVNAGSTNIVAVLSGSESVYTAKVPVTVSVDTSSFAGLEAKTISEAGGSRSASSTLYYEKGVGLWFMIEANHNAFTKGWGGSGLDLDVTINGKEYWLYYGNGGVGAVSTGADGVGFDLSKSTIVVTKNAEGSATAYSTLMVALLSEQTLLADGASQEAISEGTVTIDWLAIKSPGEDSITGTGSGMWLIHGEAHVCEEGYFIPQKPLDLTKFEGLEVKTANPVEGINLSATMVYEKGVGLWVKAEATHNNFTKGWGGTGVNLEVAIGSGAHFIYYGTGGVGFIGFDEDASDMRVTENAEGAKYSTLVVGLITDATLLSSGITQDQLDSETIPVVHAAFGSPNEGWWYIHKDAYVGEKGYFVPQKPLDVSRFEGLEAKTVAEQDGTRSLSATMVYEKGVGLWVKVEANHNNFTKGWGGSGVDLEVWIGNQSLFIYYGTGGVGVIGFDATESDMRVTENATGAKYSTLVVGLITDAKLLECGVTQEQLNSGSIFVSYAAFKSPGEGNFVTTAGTNAGNNEGWWYIHKDAYVGVNGYFVPEKPLDVSRFEGLEAKTSEAKAGLSAVMVYEKGVGLWVKVNASHDVFTKGWGGSGVNVELAVGSSTHFIYYGTGGVGVLGFDADASDMRVTENATGAKYSTLVVGLITDATLLSSGLTQADLDSGIISVVHIAFGSPSEGWWYIHKAAQVNKDGYYVPAPAEPEIDVTRFEGLEAKTVTEKNGTRSLSAVMVYEKGEGLWVKVEATHNVFTKGWGGSGLNLEVAVGSSTFFIYYGTSGVGVIGFDSDASVMRVTENKGEGAKYSTLIVALITADELLLAGVSQEDINAGSIKVVHAAFKSPAEGSFVTTEDNTTAADYWYIHREAYVGENGYFVPAPVVVDPFEGLPTASLVANDGSRVLTSSMYYEKGVGLWVKVDAMHNKFAKGWAGGGLDLDITVEGVQILLYYGTSGPASCFGSGVAGGFDMNQTTFEVTEDSGKYKTAIVGLIPSQTLLDMGVSQATLDRGYLKVTTAFKSPGEGSFVDVYGYSTPADWWYIHRELLVSANGYLTGGEKVKTMSFADSTTKKAFNFSATLTEFGLYVHAEVKADAIGDGLIAFAYYTNYWSPSNGGVAQLYLGQNGGQAPTWKRVTHFTGINAATYGYSNYLVFEALYDWTFLGNLGLMSYDSANKMESTIYLSPSFCSGEPMSFNVAEGDGTIKQISSAEWRFGGSQWTAIDSATVKYITLHVTKNGIAN